MFELASHPIIDLQGGLASGENVTLAFNPLSLLLPLIAALVVSMAFIPVMVRLACRFRLVDEPDSRKVHAVPVPRVGGFGIFFGAIAPVILLLPLDQTIIAFLAGALVLFVFGILDDSRELGHYAKFIGQFIAVILVVYWGDVYVTRLPFVPLGVVSESAGQLFTVFAMVGMINAMNHSDGLDGLAGGEALLSLCSIAWLAFVADGQFVSFVALSLVGSLLGFMRYNTHPAIIFMGDSGSQFLGYTLGFLVVLLTQQVNPALSPALPALILGLPVADIIAVFAQRVYRKMNWFRATRNHIHHRLLDLGFYHYESVIIIYTIQTILVVFAVLMPYESDAAVLGLYIAIIAAVFLVISVAEHSGWQTHVKQPDMTSAEMKGTALLASSCSRLSYWILSFGLAGFLASGSLMATRIPPDFTLLAMVLFGMLLVRLIIPGMARFLPLRAMCYMAIAFVVYLLNNYQPAYLSGTDLATYLFFGVIAGCVAMAIRFSEKGGFSLTPTDFLVIIVIASLAILSSRGMVDSKITAVALKAIILFYGCEVVLNRMKSIWNVFTVSVLISLIVISLRGMNLFPVNL